MIKNKFITHINDTINRLEILYSSDTNHQSEIYLCAERLLKKMKAYTETHDTIDQEGEDLSTSLGLFSVKSMANYNSKCSEMLSDITYEFDETYGLIDPDFLEISKND